MWLVSYEAITGESPTERLERCVFRTNCSRQNPGPFRHDRIRPAEVANPRVSSLLGGIWFPEYGSQVSGRNKSICQNLSVILPARVCDRGHEW